MQQRTYKHVFFVFLIIGVYLMFVSPLAFTQNDEEVPGFNVHADKQYIEVFKQIFPAQQ